MRRSSMTLPHDLKRKISSCPVADHPFLARTSDFRPDERPLKCPCQRQALLRAEERTDLICPALRPEQQPADQIALFVSLNIHIDETAREALCFEQAAVIV